MRLLLMLRVLVVAVVATMSFETKAQMLVPPWGPKLADLMGKYNACDAAGNESSPSACNIFLARALKEVYGVIDFDSAKRSAAYLSANEIATNVLISKHWENIGSAADPAALEQAQQDANRNIAVIAVWKNPDPKKHGHVALILPGELTNTSWGPSPNSASFFLNKPLGQSYIGLPLSKAFKQEIRQAVQLYRRRD